jgi:potassium/hydrogen antiporter
MTGSIEEIFLVIAILIILSVVASKISDYFGIPALLVFLVVGMLAGSEGLGKIYFDDPTLAQAVGFRAGKIS